MVEETLPPAGTERTGTGDLHRRVVALLSHRYEGPVLNNAHRAEYVEAMIAEILGPQWRLPWTRGYFWAPWDLDNRAGHKIEVKQSAALQAWASKEYSSRRFDIAPRKGYWTEGWREGEWIDRPGRVADIYIFAWHGEKRRFLADQRDPAQWAFHVVPTGRLPSDQRSIALSRVAKLSAPCDFEALPAIVRDALPCPA